jgi:hypothetical protein
MGGFLLGELFQAAYASAQNASANGRGALHLKKSFAALKLAEVSSDQIEGYLRHRLRHRVRIKTAAGVREAGLLKPATVHQEFRVLGRILNVAVRKKLLPFNPCSGEFPVVVRHLFRPHYMSWWEQQKIESLAPDYLRNVTRIITETGLRVYEELAP